MSSVSGRFLYQFGITAAVAILVSLLVSFTLTPMMSARLLAHAAAGPGHRDSRGGFYGRLDAAYERLLESLGASLDRVPAEAVSVPYFAVLGVTPKKTPFTLGLFTAVSLCTLWLERCLLVLPSVPKEAGPVFGVAELGPTLGFLGLFLLSYGFFARTFPMGSPRLALIALEKEAGHH